MLRGKNIVVTGARRGIGRAVVERMARGGANVWACARTQNDLFEQDMAELAEKYDVIITPIYFDLNNIEEVKLAVKSIVKEHRSIDCLINNAGVAYYEKLQFMKIDKAKDIFDNNYFGSLLLTQLIMRKITKDTGSIIFVSSIAGFFPEIGNVAYGGSKAALSHATKVLALEMGDNGIRVNAVAPGLVETEMKDIASEESWDALVKRTALKRSCKPEEIANVICFLASTEASYINGQTICVDGGIS